MAGRLVLGSTYATWYADSELVVSLHWGALNDHHARDLLAMIECTQLGGNGPSSLLVDCREIDHVDVDALLDLTTRLEKRTPMQVGRFVAAVPTGLTGLLLSGALIALAPKSRLQLVHDLERAVALIDHPAAAAAHAAATEAARTARGTSLILGRVRGYILQDLVDARIGDCATALGLSTRTLQRELVRLATSFSDELRRLRVQAATELLRLTDTKVDVIANRVGLCNASRLNAVLRRDLDVCARDLRFRTRGRQWPAGNALPISSSSA